MRQPKIKYRNNEERVYMKTLTPLLNMEKYQLEALDEMEERYSKVRGTGGNSEGNVKTQLDAKRVEVLFTQKLLAAVKSCEPAICRSEEAGELPLG